MNRALALSVALVWGCDTPAPERSRAIERDARVEPALRTTDVEHGLLENGAFEPGVVQPGVIEPGVVEPGVVPRDDARAPPESIPEGVDSIAPSACGACHRAELRQWRDSGHARAFTEPLFQREHAHRRSRWCTRCHAPRTRGIASGDPRFEQRTRLGVDCASCHVRGGAIVAARVSGEAPHASHVDPSFATAAACAGCHEFAHRTQPELMVQRTLTEHARSDAADTPCQGCHMPDGAGHRFVGARDGHLRRRALAVQAEAAREGERVRLTMRLRSRAGHAVPTGDLARRLEVTAHLGRDVRAVELGRSIRVDGRRLVEGDDTRVPPDGVREVTLELHGEGRHVTWRVDLLTLPFGGDREGLDEASLRHRVTSGRTEILDARCDAGLCVVDLAP